MKIINLTPHTLNIFKEDGSELVIPKTQVSEGRYLVLRCSTQSTIINVIDGIEEFETSFGELEIGTVDHDGNDFVTDWSLSIPTDGDRYIVSMVCLNAIQRMNSKFFTLEKFRSPGSLIKKDGVPVGCKGLSKL